MIILKIQLSIHLIQLKNHYKNSPVVTVFICYALPPLILPPQGVMGDGEMGRKKDEENILFSAPCIHHPSAKTAGGQPAIC